MNWSISIFKIKGIKIKVHLTFILILIWAAYRWSITTGEGIQGALFGLVATLMLFSSVVLHELGHSWQALKQGVEVHDITLLPMGGVAHLEEIPEEPARELRIAAAGPLVNIIIAGLMFLFSLVLENLTVISLSELYSSMGQVSWSGLYSYLALTNLFLGLFNLVPAFPMDGGRILRALLSTKISHARATQIASKVGQGLALVFGLWGFMNSNYSLVLIAIFVWLGAGQENHGVQQKGALAGMSVAQAMTPDPLVLKPNDPLSKAVDMTLSSLQSSFPVVEWGSNKVVGLLSEADILKGLQVHSPSSSVRLAMRANLPVVHQDDPLLDVQGKLRAARLSSVPVVDEDASLNGLLRVEDINEAYRFSVIGT